MTIRVHPQQQYLMWEDGTPFYPIADTAWTLPQRLRDEQVEQYADCRKEQGFNTVLICSFSELDGVRVPNQYGEFPFACPDPLQPLEDYWRRLDRFLEMFWSRGMVVGLLPTWGDKFNCKGVGGPEIFTPENAYTYARWLASRYVDEDRLFWVLGGDRPLDTDVHREIMRRMAAGLRSVDSRHLITFHPCGAVSSTDFVAGEPWVDFHSMQSGHGLECWDSVAMFRKSRCTEDKPCWDMECRYEDFPVAFDESTGLLWSAADVRWNIYENMMAGACGQSYGHRDIWRFDDRPGKRWEDALSAPAAQQQRIAASLRCRGDYFAFRAAPEYLSDPGTGPAEQCAAATTGMIFFYTPGGDAIRADLTSLPKSGAYGHWFDPRTGEEGAPFAVMPCRQELAPPTSGEDWVLIVEFAP